MADPKQNATEDTKEQNKKVDYKLISLSIPEIISALHQKAIATCPPDLRIANSAIEGDGKTAKLTSAGQHIISVLAVKEGNKVKKSAALEPLKNYVKAFVGPDLANKVTDKVLMKLGSDEEEKKQTEENQDKSKEKESPEEKNKEKSKEPTEEANKEKPATEEIPKKESINTDVKSFQKFLVEDCGMKFLFEETGKLEEEKEKHDTKKGDKPKDGDDEEAIGWYIAYNLKVQGLKETNLEDAMKDFALSFFDNLKITASGLFGGGQELTGKDVRKSFHDLLHVDYKKLAENFKKLLERDYPIASKDAEIDVTDPKSLLRRLGKTKLSKDEKTAILGANYSLMVKYKEEDPTSPILNKKRVAELIRKSLKGFRFGTKLDTTAGAIIKIENFVDLVNSREAKAEVAKLPSAIVITKFISSEKFDLVKAVFTVDRAFKTVEKNKKSMEQEEVKSAVALWKNYYNKLNQLVKQIETARKNKKDASKIESQGKTLFQEFRDKYEQTIKEIEGSDYISSNAIGSFSESSQRIAYARMIEKQHIADCIMQLLFEEYSSNFIDPAMVFGNGLNEDDVDEDTTDYQKLTDSLKSAANANLADEKAKSAKIAALPQKEAISKLSETYDVDETKLSKFKSCAVIDFHPDSSIKMQESIKGKQIGIVNEAKSSFEILHKQVENTFGKFAKSESIPDDSKGDIIILSADTSTDESMMNCGVSKNMHDLMLEADSSDINNIGKLVKSSFENIINDDNKNFHQNIKYKVAKSGEVGKWINDEVSIKADSVISKIQEKEYAAAFYIKVLKRLKNKKTGKMSSKPKGTKNSDRITDSVAETTFKNEVLKDIDFDFYTESGTSSKLKYNESSEPADIKLFVAAFDLKEDADVNPPPGETPPNKGKKAYAFVLPFTLDNQNPGDEKPPEVEPEDDVPSPDDAGNGVDLYIYPIASAKDFNDAGDIE